VAVKAHSSYPARETDSAFTTTKKDKRLMKHSMLMSKVHDAGVKKQKRRRPGKKLVTDLEALGDALQHVAGHDHDQDQSRAAQMKNVREGRGQAKRREKLVKEERARFGQNMAVLSATNAASTPNDANAHNHATGGGRWAALRAHIQATMAESLAGSAGPG
jgi:hypothetical protein